MFAKNVASVSRTVMTSTLPSAVPLSNTFKLAYQKKKNCFYWSLSCLFLNSFINIFTSSSATLKTMADRNSPSSIYNGAGHFGFS